MKLIGGEMPTWSDRPPAHSPVLSRLAALVVPDGGRILIVGPHDPALVAELAARAAVTCLLRSHPDAAGLTGVDVLCGTLPKLPATDEYDVIVALDGVTRLCSVEGPQYDWADSVAVLKRALRPGGTLLLHVENHLGVHRLVDPRAATSPRGDADWHPVGEFDDSMPGNPNRLAAALSADGLAVSWLGALWPSLLATPQALRDGPVDALAAHAARSAGALYAGRSVLSDPRRLAATAVRSGLGPEFSVGWVVVAHRSPRSAFPSLPAALLGTGAGVVTPDASLPAGRLLEELLISAAVHHDLPRLRRLLTGWGAALATTPVDNVVFDGVRYAILDPSVPGDPEPMRTFAATLIGGGYPHPWPAATSVAALTAVLSGAAGLRAAASSGAAGPPAAPDSLREHQEQVRALKQQLADAQAQVRWHENELIAREKEVGKLRKQLTVMLPYRAARRARTVLRNLKKDS